jgi:hypothetical protein
MKKVLAVLFLTVSVSAMAQHHHGHHKHWRHGGGNNWVWVAPALIGGVIGYEISRNQPPAVVQQLPVIIQNPQFVQQTCSPWIETQYPDGSITKTRTCQQ